MTKFIILRKCLNDKKLMKILTIKLFDITKRYVYNFENKISFILSTFSIYLCEHFSQTKTI